MVLEIAKPDWSCPGNNLAVRGELCGLIIRLVDINSTVLNA